MNGLELSRAYYEAFGAEMLHRDFPEWEGRIAVGLCGSGSECFGFDDGISRDHDYEPGFCLFIPEEDEMDRRTAFRLERAYAKLPAEFMGLTRQKLSPVGGSRRGVFRRSEFFLSRIGRPDTALTTGEWLSIPDYALAEAVNGQIFRDDEGVFTAMRNALLAMPEDVRRRRLASQLLTMAQAGQYNYRRILAHGEEGAAQLAAAEFAEAALKTAFLLNRRYMPFYKWSFRALRDLPRLSGLCEPLTLLLAGGRDVSPEEKTDCIEEVAAAVIGELGDQALTRAVCGDLEKHAWSVCDGISDPGLRNAPL